MNENRLRLLNLLLLAALWAASAAVYPRLPEQIPTHFNLAGTPDAWSPRTLLTWFMLPLIATALVAFLGFMGRVAETRPELWNVPEKGKFLDLAPEARAPIVARLRSFMACMGIGTTAVLAIVQAQVYLVAKDGKVPSWLVAAAIMAVVGGISVAGMMLNRRLKHEIRDARRRSTA